MPDAAVLDVPLSLDRRVLAALEAAARGGGDSSCRDLLAQLPAASRSSARGVVLGAGYSLWHASWPVPVPPSMGWLIEPGRVRRLTWQPRLRVIGGQPHLECLLDTPAPSRRLSIAVLTERQQLRLIRLGAPAPVSGLGALLARTGGEAGAARAVGDWLRALKPFLPGAPDAARALLEAERLHRRPAAAAGGDPRGAAPDQPFGIGIDYALPLPDGSVVVKGWLRDPLAMLAGLTATTAFGTSVEVACHTHPDPARPGQRLLFGRSQPTRDPGTGTHLTLAARLAGGHRVELVPPQPPLSASDQRDLLLRSIPVEALSGPGGAALLDGGLAPALAALQAAHRQGPRVAAVRRIGDPPTRPAWSVIVPLYRNLRFLRHQAAAFALDRSLAAAELVYVLDSPEQAEQLEHMLLGLHRAFGIAAQLVVHTRNFGFASAINSGVAASTGSRLLLLNSDVIPLAEPTAWLPRLQRHLDRTDNGVVGAKLLFDDDSLQHAGLHWALDEQGEWYNRHYHKGYPRDHAPACRSRSVPAVTGACLAVRRASFDQVGGICEDYVIGDYEDSDFCLKIRAAGGDCRYAADVELYHMERQSIREHAAYHRTAACHYNRRLHHGRWASAIAGIEAAFARSPAR
ncbi:glycosyltransferase [Azospirillum picis]|uniref:GT2 family glycosyltransferase n=1 Tax=Azospirillum picis TaxID=488438 RepID=A0ABU0MU33_9PROT|nr:glycosyltransferase [Azospirillum picis]MBP2300905.1 GT2 family glycosyltransferase [Azospirillum picis]MDQ0537009.1 GT2 family glycosyltransferase [Azospirillum picis]